MQSESDMQVLYSADNTAHNITLHDTTSLYISVLYINALNCKALHSTRHGMISLYSSVRYGTVPYCSTYLLRPSPLPRPCNPPPLISNKQQRGDDEEGDKDGYHVLEALV
jgi:hypothetical protein